MNDQLSFEEAKRLSIIKWEAIIKDKGERLNETLISIPEIRYLNGHCGFCERYRASIGNYHTNCGKCEFGKIAGICFSSRSLFMQHSFAHNTKLKLAKQILKVIKSLNENS